MNRSVPPTEKEREFIMILGNACLILELTLILDSLTPTRICVITVPLTIVSVHGHSGSVFSEEAEMEVRGWEGGRKTGTERTRREAKREGMATDEGRCFRRQATYPYAANTPHLPA